MEQEKVGASLDSAQTYREIIAYANVGIVVYDREFRYTVWNHFMEELTGVASEHVLGRKATDVFPHLQERGIDLLLHQALEGQRVTSPDTPYVVPQTGKSGWVVGSYGPHYNAANEIIGVIASIRDITERKLAEIRLQESERQYKSIVDAMPDLIFRIDHEGTYLDYSAPQPGDLYASPDTFLRKKVVDVLPPEVSQVCMDAIHRAFDTKSVQVFEYSLPMPQGTRYFEARLVVSAVDEVLTIVRDITERKQTEEMRERLMERIISAQDQERRRIARELHDETGQSLTAVLVGLRMMEQMHTLHETDTQAKRLRQTISHTIEDLERLIHGLHPSILDDLGLLAALNRYGSDYSKSFGVAVALETEGLATDRLPLHIETTLFRITQEALTNVAKHALARNVRIVLHQEQDSITLILQDDGIGFDVGVALRSSGASSSLGLHGLQERAALLGGFVEWESELGKGTRIRVSIPTKKK